MSYDPYYSVQGEIRESLSKIESYFDSWSSMVNSGRAVESEDFDGTEHELTMEIGNMKEIIQIVEESIEKARANKARFKLDDNEINNRLQFLREAKEKTQTISDSLNDPSVKVKLDKERRERLLIVRAHEDRQTALDRAREEENDKFIEGENSRQKLIVRDQDENLEDLSHSVGILGQMGKDIGNELEEHAVLLEDLETNVDSTNTNLKKATSKIKKIMKASRHDYFKFATIILLVILLAVVIILALYT